MKRIGCVALLLMTSIAGAQKLPWQGRLDGASIQTTRPQDVQFLFPNQVTVAAGRDAVIELHFRVNRGMHINSHTPNEKWLIPTKLNVTAAPDLKVQRVEFPAGEDFRLAAMPSAKLNVYTGDFVVRAHILARPGQHVLQAMLRYQACDTNSCYPPRNAPIAIDVIAK